jgi:hypothetical protein
MPKFRVFIGETEVFDVDVAAPDEHAAIRKALDILPTAYRTAISHTVQPFHAAPLDDDAEVENADEAA